MTDDEAAAFASVTAAVAELRAELRQFHQDFEAAADRMETAIAETRAMVISYGGDSRQSDDLSGGGRPAT